MEIHEAVQAVEKFLGDWPGAGGRRPAEFTVLPSGDDKDVIKVRLGYALPDAEADEKGWATDAEKAIAAALPEVARAFRLRVRADVL